MHQKQAAHLGRALATVVANASIKANFEMLLQSTSLPHTLTTNAHVTNHTRRQIAVIVRQSPLKALAVLAAACFFTEALCLRLMCNFRISTPHRLTSRGNSTVRNSRFSIFLIKRDK